MLMTVLFEFGKFFPGFTEFILQLFIIVFQKYFLPSMTEFFGVCIHEWYCMLRHCAPLCATQILPTSERLLKTPFMYYYVYSMLTFNYMVTICLTICIVNYAPSNSCKTPLRFLRYSSLPNKNVLLTYRCTFPSWKYRAYCWSQPAF